MITAMNSGVWLLLMVCTVDVFTATCNEGVWTVPKGRMPYMVSIRRPGTRDHVCSAVLIHEFYILAPAHCVDPESQYSAGTMPIVYISAINADENNEEGVKAVFVQHTTIHPEWKYTTSLGVHSNIALLQLSEKSLEPVPQLLTDHFPLNSGQILEAVGWGSPTGPDLGDSIFSTLKTEEQEVIGAIHCNISTLWNSNIKSGTLCGLNRRRKASCVVDSGAPILLLDAPQNHPENGNPIFDFVVGLNVDGAACGTVGKPDIYIDLRPHNEWITNIIDGRAVAQEL